MRIAPVSLLLLASVTSTSAAKILTWNASVSVSSEDLISAALTVPKFNPNSGDLYGVSMRVKSSAFAYTDQYLNETGQLVPIICGTASFDSVVFGPSNLMIHRFDSSITGSPAYLPIPISPDSGFYWALSSTGPALTQTFYTAASLNTASLAEWIGTGVVAIGSSTHASWDGNMGALTNTTSHYNGGIYARYSVDVSIDYWYTQGDFNRDGGVDSLDYVMWRKGFGTTYAANDYSNWRANFGDSAIPREIGSGAASSVPEPLSCELLVSVACLIMRRNNRNNLSRLYK